MLGKVWSSGALAVVQNVAIIPSSVHPRDKLEGGLTDRLAELMYIPIYDMRQPDAGVLACLEVAISAAATEALVANIISEAADLLSQLQLALSKPEDMQRTSSGSSASPRSTPRMASPQTPSAQLPPLRMVPPPPQAMVAPAPSAFASAAACPPSMPGSPVTGSSYSSRSSTSSRSGSPTYRAASHLSRTSSMARTQSVRYLDGIGMDAMRE